MSAAPETKYSDRDVREGGDDLRERAIHWVENYSGEFEYLIDMKMRIQSGYPITTPMVRGILNCMRHDPRVTDLPEPLPPDRMSTPKHVADVVDISQSRRSRRRRHRSEPMPCGNKESHGRHWWTSNLDEDGMCEGMPYRINRPSAVYSNVNVRRPYVVSRSGRLIHQVAPDGHTCEWHPKYHAWGFEESDMDQYPWHPKLHVNLVCKFPSVLTNPLLITTFDLSAFLQVGYTHCPHCAASSPQHPGGDAMPEQQSVLPKEKRDRILEILSDDSDDDGYDCEYATAENALDKAEEQIQQWLFVDPSMTAEAIAEKVYSTSDFWE